MLKRRRLAAVRRLLWRTVVRSARVLLLLMLVAAGSAFAAYRWFDKNILATLPSDLSEFRQYRPPTACRVYAADGTEVDQFYLERRVWVPLEDVPLLVQQAFVSAEDRRFFDHPGVDALGILRAVVENIRAGSVMQGGSTLTQQLVKNLIVGKERSFQRKLREAVLAYRLEKELSKEGVLELYLNYVYLGSGNYGVEAAAQDYYGVPTRALTVGQAATIAGMVPAPSRYSPRGNPAVAIERREIVLRTMARDGHLDADEVAAAMKEPVLQPREQRPERASATAYVTQVRREIRRVAGAELPFQEGLQVHTALDLRVQQAAHEAVRKALEELADRQGRRGPVQRLASSEWEPFLERAPGLERDARGGVVTPQPGDCFKVLVDTTRDLSNLRAGPGRFQLREEDRNRKIRDLEKGRRTAPLAQHVREGDVLRVCVETGSVVALDSRPWGEGAAVVLENDTGKVVALVGGYEVGLEGFIRATQARRQPGSSFKPIVYAARLARGGSQLDMVLDAPLALPAGGGKIWSPKNYTGTFAGPLPMRSAMSQSLNTVAVRLAMDVGPGEIVRLAHAMGVRSSLRTDLTVALGSAEVTPMDLAMAYATIARMGVPTAPVYIQRVEDSDGEQLGVAGGPLVVHGTQVADLPGGALPRALPADAAYQVADMLREVVRSGTARKAFVAGRDRAGKTGTTNGYEDAWFVGFTPKHTVAVWIGTDGKIPLGDKETGGKTALPAWMAIVEALGETEGARLPVPDEVVLVPHGPTWVGLSREHLPSAVLPVTRAGDEEALPPFPVRAGRPTKAPDSPSPTRVEGGPAPSPSFLLPGQKG